MVEVNLLSLLLSYNMNVRGDYITLRSVLGIGDRMRTRASLDVRQRKVPPLLKFEKKNW
jgi:hypothetical protein